MAPAIMASVAFALAAGREGFKPHRRLAADSGSLICDCGLAAIYYSGRIFVECV
jgi:hypothetical protein